MKSVRRVLVYCVILSLLALSSFPAKVQAECSVGYLRWPLSGAPNWSNITRGFGGNWDSNKCESYFKKHVAIDYPAPQWSVVLAASWGTVKESYTHASDVGVVVIEHGYGCFTTVYWHLVPVVSKGSDVFPGQMIGYLGKPKDSAPHLHFGIRSAPYTIVVSKAGYLPEGACNGYPAFPERFVNPLNFYYYW